MKQEQKISKYRAIPSDIGKSVAILLRSYGNGDQEHTRTVEKRKIINVYDNGAILDDVNEVWFIRPYNKYGTDFVTVK